MDDGRQFAERYLNNDLSYNEYIDFLYDIELEKDKENQKKVLNPSYIIKENKDTSLFFLKPLAIILLNKEVSLFLPL